MEINIYVKGENGVSASTYDNVEEYKLSDVMNAMYVYTEPHKTKSLVNLDHMYGIINVENDLSNDEEEKKTPYNSYAIHLANSDVYLVVSAGRYDYDRHTNELLFYINDEKGKPNTVASFYMPNVISVTKLN